jgi:hypothetical protein
LSAKERGARIPCGDPSVVTLVLGAFRRANRRRVGPSPSPVRILGRHTSGLTISIGSARLDAMDVSALSTSK